KAESSKTATQAKQKKAATSTTTTKTTTADRASQDTLTDPDMQNEPNTMISAHDDHSPPPASPSPPPGWKGKAKASAVAPSTPPPPARSTLTPNQPTTPGSASSPRTSMTRSAGRRIQRAAGVETVGKRERDDDEGVTEEGSPVGKKVRRG
ncbi:MAG: hypothetical protein Q9204_009419, partial [Flavoplaca sp. TL-2023a]